MIIEFSPITEQLDWMQQIGSFIQLLFIDGKLNHEIETVANGLAEVK